MSHIYEALERAQLERKIAADSAIAAPTDPLAVDFDSGSAADPLTVAFDSPTDPDPLPGLLPTIEGRPWEPNSLFVPTIAEHNSTIEQFRGLRSKIYQLRDKDNLKTIVISSGMPAEGKTFVSINLALSLARNNEAGVLLIDGDLRNPSIHKQLGTNGDPGLREFLAGKATPSEILQRYKGGGDNPGARALSHLACIPGGQGGTEPPALAGNDRLEELMEAVAPHFAWIIIDTPPVLLVSDAVDFSRVADGVLLVARGGVTPYDSARRTKASFANSRILGVVLNAVKNVPEGYGY